MISFGTARGKEATRKGQEALDQAHSRIAEHENLMFGIALYYECLKVLYEGQELILKTHHDQLLAVIRIGDETMQQAAALMTHAEKDAKQAAKIMALPLNQLEGYEQAEELRERAQRLVKAFKRVFPARDRDQPLSEDEILCLLDAATLAPRE